MSDREELDEDTLPAMIFAGEDKAEQIFEELCRDKGLSAASALWLHNERDRLISLAHDLYLYARGGKG